MKGGLGEGNFQTFAVNMARDMMVPPEGGREASPGVYECSWLIDTRGTPFSGCLIFSAGSLFREKKKKKKEKFFFVPPRRKLMIINFSRQFGDVKPKVQFPK